MGESSQILQFLERFVEQDIDKAVKILEDTPKADAASILGNLSVRSATSMLARLQTSFAANLLQLSETGFAISILSALPPSKAATLVMYLPSETREALLPAIPGKLAERIRELYTYPEGSIGRFMSTDYLTFLKHEEAGDVIEKIRAMANKKAIPSSYSYVIDDDGLLQGVLNMRDLMLAESTQPLSSFMISNVFTLHCFTDRTDAAREMAKRKYFAAPVVDSEDRLLGVIKAENMLTGLKEDVTSDLLKMVGAGGDERTFSPIRFSLKK